MLYDQKWDRAKTEEEILSMANLIRWLETKDPKENYNYHICDGTCLYGQYMAAHGISWWDSGASHGGSIERMRFCTNVYVVACQNPWTFGAALKRAREFDGE